MARGGKRAGAGRKANSAGKLCKDAVVKAKASGKMPVDFLLDVMRGKGSLKLRVEAAKAAAPYLSPKLTSIEHSGAIGSSQEEFVKAFSK